VKVTTPLLALQPRKLKKLYAVVWVGAVGAACLFFLVGGYLTVPLGYETTTTATNANNPTANTANTANTTNTNPTTIITITIITTQAVLPCKLQPGRPDKPMLSILMTHPSSCSKSHRSPLYPTPTN
jgi:hypothetical protein